MTRTGVTLPLGGQFEITRLEARNLSEYLDMMPIVEREAYTVWRASDGHLYLQTGGGKLQDMSEVSEAPIPPEDAA